MASRNAGHSSHRSTAWSEGRAPNIHLANPSVRTPGSGSISISANVRGRLQPRKRNGRRPDISTTYPRHGDCDHRADPRIPSETPPLSGCLLSAVSGNLVEAAQLATKRKLEGVHRNHTRRSRTGSGLNAGRITASIRTLARGLQVSIGAQGWRAARVGPESRIRPWAYAAAGCRIAPSMRRAIRAARPSGPSCLRGNDARVWLASRRRYQAPESIRLSQASRQ
jgi:hypothetical protein